VITLYRAVSDNNKEIQRAQLNGIIDNGINRLMESNLSRFTSPKLHCHTYHRLLFISYGLAQSDPIKWCPMETLKPPIIYNDKKHTALYFTCDIQSLRKSAWIVLWKNLVDQIFVADEDQLALAEREDFIVLEGRKVVGDENQDWHLEITNVRELSENVKVERLVKILLRQVWQMVFFNFFCFCPFWARYLPNHYSICSHSGNLQQ
jgi:hypothetical protein